MKTIKLLSYTDIENIDISKIEIRRLEHNNPEEFIEHTMDYEKNPILYGIELEVNYLQDSCFREKLKKYQEDTYLDFFHCKYDGSLHE